MVRTGIKSLLGTAALIAAAQALATTASFAPATPPPVAPAAAPKETTPTLSAVVKPLAGLIGSAESDNVGGYDAANNGRPMDLGRDGLRKHFGREAGKVTVGEILLAQAQGRLHAVGRYQVIGMTMQEVVDLRCVDGRDYFNQETQDRILICLLQHKRPQIWHYLTTGKGIHTAARSLAYEWASMPYTDGRSYHGGWDKAKTTRSELFNALEAARSNYLGRLGRQEGPA